jgi:hypothetical protein
MITESVKIDAEIVARIRKRVAKTGQKISGFINVVLESKLDEMENQEAVLGSSYTDAMVSILQYQKEKVKPVKSNKKKK